MSPGPRCLVCDEASTHDVVRKGLLVLANLPLCEFHFLLAADGPTSVRLDRPGFHEVVFSDIDRDNVPHTARCSCAAEWRWGDDSPLMEWGDHFHVWSSCHAARTAG